MPHIIVEYSANLDAELDPRALVRAVHAAVRDSGTFELGAIRTRAARRDVFEIADGDADNAFINVMLMIGPGRDAMTKKRVSLLVMGVLEEATRARFATKGTALTVYVEELDDAAASRTNNLHARMKAKAGG